MAILNYTTSIACEKTIMEIQKCLVGHGATKIVTDYTGEVPTAVTFCLVLNGNLSAFALPANYSGVLKAMKGDKKVPRRLLTDEQALKVSWRIIKNWVEAQMAIVEAELADVAEVFLPYAITKNGTTLYKEIQSNGIPLLDNQSK
nr:hypothetical protein [uncultured Allomuricauda sp.]